jgi:hypothetical protein
MNTNSENIIEEVQEKKDNLEDKIDVEIPDKKEQKELIKKIIKKDLVEGDIWYLIDSSWFNNWKKYINFDDEESKETNEFPGPIDNSSLCLPNSTKENPKLRKFIHENINYIFVNEEVGRYLYEW